jgi:hypothetical protein
VNVLEQRYRRVLRVLPASYREMWEEDMVATFLESVATDDADKAEYLADFGRPGWSEVASVLALALRVRLGGTGASPRYVAWGGAVRLVTLVWLLGQAVLGSAGVAIRMWLTGKLRWLPGPPVEWAAWVPMDVWHKAGDLAGLVWVLAFFALVLGHPRAARVLTALAVLPIVVLAIDAVRAALAGGGPLLLTLLSLVLLDLSLLVGMVAFHHDVQPVPVRPWAVAFAAGVPIVAGLLAVPVLDWPGLYCVAVTIAAVVHLARPGDRSPAWSHALAVLALVVLALRAVTLVDYLLGGVPAGSGAVIVLGAVEAAVLAIVSVPLAVTANRALRGMPTVPPARRKVVRDL